MREAPRSYTPHNLYEYIDGNADLFLSYGFADAAVGDDAPAKGDGWVSVDVYNMGTPLQAFGIFGAERPDAMGTGSGPHPVPVPVRAAAQSYESDGLTAFWKGPYYVKVSLVDGSDTPAARKLAEVTAERIPGEAAMPVELALLPVEGRVPGSERYLKTSALGHKFLVEVVSANYQLGDNIAMLSIADLATPERAAEGSARLREFEASTGGSIADLAGVGEDGFAVRDPYYGEMAAARTGQFLVIGLSEKAARGAVEELVAAGVSSLVPARDDPEAVEGSRASVGAHGPSATLRVNDAPPADVPKG